MTPRLRTVLTLLAAAVGLGLAAIAATGCDGATADPGCVGKCDGTTDVKAQLAGHDDPIGTFLRTQTIDAKGVMVADYATVLHALATQQGCSDDTIGTFAVSDNLLTGGSPFPRLISVACVSDDARASDFFMAASFQDAKTKDVNLRDVEMFGWDATARRFRFYAFTPVKRSKTKVQLEVDPPRCRQCHQSPTDLPAVAMPMTPIMNELTRPWTHWNAQPGFTSFEYQIPTGIDQLPNFMAFAVKHQAPASRFEEIIKNGGHAKVVQARLRDRRNPANLDETMNLLRPLFCSEQVNYVTEDFSSGQILYSAVVDLGARNMMLQIRPNDWPQGWVNDQSLRLPSGGDPLQQVPVRGNAELAYEQQLVSLRALTPQQVLRIRALDWQHPVLSDFRCGLWRDAQVRFRTQPPKLGGAAHDADAMPAVLDAILVLGGQRLAAGTDDTFVVLPSASATDVAALQQALGAGSLASATCGDASGFCTATADQLAALIDRYVVGFQSGDGRARLQALRDARLCQITAMVAPSDDRFESKSARFENHPALPDVACP